MIITNVVGARAAARFRARFGLKLVSKSYDKYGVSGDAHDYLHTILGALPVVDEYDVLQLEEAIITGRVPMPRGLENGGDAIG